MISKNNVDLAWKLYNYLNTWEGKIFGSESCKNTPCIFILTLVAFYGGLSNIEIMKKTNTTYSEMYRFIESLTRYYQFLEYNRKKDKYELSSALVKSALDSDVKTSEINEKVFCTLLNNMKYHIKIFSDNLSLDPNTNSKFNVMKALLNPVVSKPIHVNNLKQLSYLGYMKYNPQSKKLKLNAVAYKKDWAGTNVI